VGSSLSYQPPESDEDNDAKVMKPDAFIGILDIFGFGIPSCAN
jgi:hypothetical protein